jgi:hypothetical protein
MEKRKQWLDFDHEKFEEARTRDGEDSAFYGFLNVTVTNDNTGGDSEETVITFDTGGHGGSYIRVGTDDLQDFTSDKVTLTLYGGLEATAFFSAMENLTHCYKLRTTIGE